MARNRKQNRNQSHLSPPQAAPVASASGSALANVEKLLVRYQVSIRRRLPVLLLSLTSGLLLTLSFEPFNLWFLPWLALTPWLVAIATSQRWAWMLFCSWLTGFLFFAVNLYWLLACGYPGPWLGVLLMAGAELALSAYLGLYFLLFAYVVGGLARRWGPRRQPSAPSGLMMTYLVPIAWLGTELLRGYVMSGFPWFLLGHSLYQHVTMIQIADLGGAYAVSFLIAATNGLIADGLLQPLFLPTRKGPRPNYQVSAATLALLGLVLLTVVYGRYRIHEFDRVQSRGAMIGVIQNVNRITLKGSTDAEMQQRTDEHFELAHRAAHAQPRPDLVAWPETMIDANLNPEYLNLRLGRPTDPEKLERYRPAIEYVENYWRSCHLQDRRIRELVRQSNAAMLVGAHSSLLAPPWPAEEPIDATSVYYLTYLSRPVGHASPNNRQMLRYNSAHLYQLASHGAVAAATAPAASAPDVLTSHYDKHHLVPFGEYIPFRHSWPAAFKFLSSLTPMALLIPGENLEPLVLTTRHGRQVRIATPICYEDVVPQAIRRLVYGPDGRKQVDVLVNISNDGWFAGTTELKQHWSTAVFRCIENRVPMARSVNCGCSGFIDSVGRPMGMLAPGAIGHLTAAPPLDSRVTLYSRIGDCPWFICAGLLFAGAGVVFVRRLRRPRN